MAQRNLSSIYGADDNDFASGVASDALSAKVGNEDYWFDDPASDPSAIAKANVGEEQVGPLGAVPKLKSLAGGNFGDNEKLAIPSVGNRRRDGDAAFAGYEKKLVPKNQTGTRGRGPAYNNEAS